jgi:transcriptional regulator with XRE-family HTH domain
MNDEKFGDWFRKERQQKEVGVRELAKVLGVSPTYISMVERGDAPPFSIENIRKAQEVIGYSYSKAMLLSHRCSHCGGRLKDNDNG